MSRNLTAYANSAQPSRIHLSAANRGDVRTFVANFTALLPAGETITTATWRSEGLSALAAAIDGPLVEAVVTVGNGCSGRMKCEATFSGGGKASVVFRLVVRRGPYFSGEPATPGPTSLTVTV